MKLMNFLSVALTVILATLVNVNNNAYAGGMGVTYYHTGMENGWIRRQPPPYGIGGVHRHPGYDSHRQAAPPIVRARREPPLLRHSVSTVLTDVTHFDFDRAGLQPAGKDAMTELLRRAQGLNPNYGMGRYGIITGIDLVGHTDNIGSHSYNDRLGQRRAAAVEGFLQSKGIHSANVRISSQGKRSPVADNDTETGRALNRRTEVILHMVTVPDWRK